MPRLIPRTGINLFQSIYVLLDEYERRTTASFEGGLRLQESKRKAQIDIMCLVSRFLLQLPASLQDASKESLSSLMDSIAENDQARTRLLVNTLKTDPETASLASQIEPLLDTAFAL